MFVTSDLKPVDSRVSVIIPSYNRARFLPATLDSVYAQTRPPFEVILVDDGSEDEAVVRVCADYDRLVYHRTAHCGAGAARNAGLAIARGEYVAFLDSDDVWQRRFLERMTAALDAAPGAGFAYCDYATFGAAGTARAAYLPPKHKRSGNVFMPLLETDFLSTGALVVRRACFARLGGFDSTLATAEDWDLWLRLARAFDAVYVDEPLVHIRTGSDGLTRNTLQLHADNLRVMTKWRHTASGNALQQRLVRRNLCASHRGLALGYWRTHEPWRALRHYGLSLVSGFL